MSGRPREFDQEEALEKAMEIFWDRGYQGTGLAELVERTGVAKQSLYNTFGNKKDLFLAALRHYGSTRHQAILDVLKGPGRAIDRIEQVFTMWEELAESQDCKGCLLVNSTAELGSADADMVQALLAPLKTLERAFVRVLEQARAEGDLASELETRALARFLVTTVHGLSVLRKLPLPRTFTRDVVAVARAALRGAPTARSG